MVASCNTTRSVRVSRRPRVLPLIYDCYALNVDGEDAVVCFYGLAIAKFHLVSVRADVATEHGISPVTGVHGLVVDGARALLVGGYPPDFDVLTPILLGDGCVRRRRCGSPSHRPRWP